MPKSSVPSRNHGRLSRRELIRTGSLGLLGLSLPGLLHGRSALAGDAESLTSSFGRAKSCILLFMWGGPAQQDTWDLKPNAPVEFRGEFKPIATRTPGIQVCEHFPLLATRTDKLAIIRSMTHGNADHGSSTHYLLTGEAPPVSADRRAEWPSMGAVLARLGHGTGALPPFVSMRPKLDNDVPRFVEESRGQWAGWLGPVFDPLIIDQDPSRADYRVAELSPNAEVSPARFRDRGDLLAGFDQASPLALPTSLFPSVSAHESSHRRAMDLLGSATRQRNAFCLDDEPARIRERYGLNPHGQSVLQARRLVERGVPLVSVFWPNDGIKNVSIYWDTHSRNFIDLKERLMPVTDMAFSALLDDLDERGLLDETLVVWTGEFGRTPRVGQVNSDAGAAADGRDHWPGCFTTVLAGGGIRGGVVYGKSDKHAAFPAENPVSPQDLIATVYHALGVRADQTIADPSGRPHFIQQGKVIQALL